MAFVLFGATGRISELASDARESAYRRLPATNPRSGRALLKHLCRRTGKT
jgi:hypothetical protein